MIKDLISKKSQLDKALKDLNNYKKNIGVDRGKDYRRDRRYAWEETDNMLVPIIITFSVGIIWIFIGLSAWFGTRHWGVFTFIVTFIPAPIMYLLGQNYYKSFKKSQKESREAKKNYIQFTKGDKAREEQFKNLKKIVSKLKKEVSKLEIEYCLKFKNHFKTNYDKNNNGEIDILENKNDFLKYLTSNQDKIIEVSEKMGEDYIHVLVKINDKLNLKRDNINKSLVEILKIQNGFNQFSNIEIYESFIKNEIQYYNTLLANSILMVSSLINNDRITFRTIYEKFDKLNIFNSHYENQTLDLLNSVNNNLKDVIKEINDMNLAVTSAIDDLAFVTQENTNKITEELKKIDTSVNFNTLVAGINAYQNYRINTKTKSLKS